MQMEKNSFKFYHEKQSGLKCAIHAVNNILQQPIYNKESFDEIAKELYEREKESKNSEILINPYKNVFGMGNYGISVIEIALLEKNYRLKWWDKRKQVDDLDFYSPDLFGFLINDKGENGFFSDLFKVLQPNHWYSILKFEKEFYDFDSRLDHPKIFKTLEELQKRLNYIKKNDGFIFLIYKM